MPAKCIAGNVAVVPSDLYFMPPAVRRFGALALLSLAMAATQSGCAGVTTYFAIDTQIATLASGGRVMSATPDAITRLPVGPNVESPFPRVQYEHQAFVLKVSAADSSLYGTIRSKVAGDVCFRFDQARLSSSMHAPDVPLRVSFGTQYRGGKALVVRASKSDGSKGTVLPQLCFSPDQDDYFSFHPDVSALFPNQRMFNAISPQPGVDPLERGIGHWLKMTVPIEYDGSREVLEIKFTATDSKTKLVVGF